MGAGNTNQELNRDIKYLYKDGGSPYCCYSHVTFIFLTLISHTIVFSFSLLEIIRFHISQQWRSTKEEKIRVKRVTSVTFAIL